MSKFLEYKGRTLARGSDAYTILSEKKEDWKKRLKQCLADTDAREAAYMDRATKVEEAERARRAIQG